ncbi:MAG TPA: hypothetical protein VN982_17280 [Candidatus Dormibacteraeota bacterium]|nr:hypothetical protein [Candidatus Dormibacteraeota bacterium]
MPVDTRGIQQSHVGKRLRVNLSSGETMEIALLELTVCENPEPCCGITYDLLSTSLPNRAKEIGGTYWTAFHEIATFQLPGE